MANKVTQNYLYSLSLNLIKTIIPLVVSPYLARILGAENIGIYSFTYAIAVDFSIFAVLGMHYYGMREVARWQNDLRKVTAIFWQIERLKFLFCCLVSVLYFAFVINYRNYSLQLGIQWAVILATLFDVSWLFQGLENYKVTSLRSIVVQVISTICIFLLVKSRQDLNIYILIQSVALIGGNVLLIPLLNKILVRGMFWHLPTFHDFGQMMELFIPLIATQVYNVLDKTMLGARGGNMYESGFYEQTTKIINIALPIVITASSVLFPRATNEVEKGDFDKVRKYMDGAFHFSCLAAWPICMGIIAIADIFIVWFFGEEYSRVIDLIYIYAWVIIIIPLGCVCGNIALTPTGNHNKGTLAVCIGALINFGLNWFLIPIFYAKGAAIATIVAECIVTYIHLVFSKRFYEKSTLGLYMVNSGIGAAVMASIVYVVGRYMLHEGMVAPIITIIQIITGVLTYYCVMKFAIKDSYIIHIRRIIHDR